MCRSFGKRVATSSNTLGTTKGKTKTYEQRQKEKAKKTKQ